MTERVDTVIVGAGLAGLFAAVALQRLGQQVCVVEARERIGGRTWTAPAPGTDIPVDWGAEWVIPGLHPRIMALIREFGLATGPERGDVEWVIPQGRLRGGYEELKHTRPGFKSGVDALQAWFDAGGDAEDRSLTELLRQVVSDDTDRVLLTAAFFPLSGADPAHYSTAATYDEIRFHDGSVDITLDPEIVRLETGTGALAHGLAKALVDSAPDVLRREWPVHEVRATTDGVQVAGPAGTVTADRALLAVPVAVLGRIQFHPPLAFAADGLSDLANAGRVTKLWARVRGEPVHTLMQATHPLRLAYERRVGNETLLSAQVLNADVRNTSEAHLDALVCSACPGVRVLDIAAHDWTADPYAGASWMTGRAGSYRPLRLALEAMNGPVKIIGGDVARDWSGWMEGAIVSAEEGIQWAS